MIATLRGNWITPSLLRYASFASLAYCLFEIGSSLIGSNGTVDGSGMLLGPDFSEIWAAGVAVWRGLPALPFDFDTHYALQRELFGPAALKLGWCYPPFFLGLAAVLALMPYGVALLVFQGATLPLYLIVMKRIAPAAGVILAALAFPGVGVNLINGHNGFLTAALLGGGLALLDRRPILAGVLFALLAYKPQFGLVIPLALAVAGRWRCFTAAAVTVVAMLVATLAAFGTATWLAFFANLNFTRAVVLEQGSTGFYKMQSVFAAVRLEGGSIPLAYALDGVVVALALAAIVWLWRSDADYRLKSAAVIAAAMLATPYSLDYDLMTMAPALAFVAAHGIEKGFGRWEHSALALAWIAPPLARYSAFFFDVPLGVISIMALFIVIIRRAAADMPPARAWQANSVLTTAG